jgi:glycine cleavage system H lipoate-binding protein
MRHEAEGTQPELPCVWVTAGVLSYRPCDREFECEGCPLYLALRRGGTAPEETARPEIPAESGHEGLAADAEQAADDPVARYVRELVSQCSVPLDRAYSTDGLWIATEPSGELRIGLDDFTLRLLQPVDDLALPRLGVWLRRGSPCASLHRGRLAIPLRCPIAGEVVAVHPRPALTPVGAGERPGKRWWFRLAPHESIATAPGVFRHEALLEWYLRRVRAVRDALVAAMEPVDGVRHPVLADGGQPVPDLEVVLGRARFEQLLGGLFPTLV